MAKSAIEWTENVWNPTTGCSKISRGCKHCYADKMSARLRAMGQPKYVNGFQPTFHPSELLRPYLEKRPLVWFVDSMSDLFHAAFSDDMIAACFAIMGLCTWHKFIVLTKRHDRMQRWFERVKLILRDSDRWRWFHEALGNWLQVAANENNVDASETIIRTFGFEHATIPFPNVALGVSVENQNEVERIRALQVTPAACRLVSLEPLVSQVFIDPFLGPQPDFDDGSPAPSLDWVIVGGESGSPDSQPLHPAWVHKIRDACKLHRIPFFFKQWGEWAPYCDESKFTHCGEEKGSNSQVWMRDDGVRGVCWIVDDDGTWSNYCGEPGEDMGRVHVFNRWGKKRAGRMLGGTYHNALPEFLSHG